MGYIAASPIFADLICLYLGELRIWDKPQSCRLTSTLLGLPLCYVKRFKSCFVNMSGNLLFFFFPGLAHTKVVVFLGTVVRFEIIPSQKAPGLLDRTGLPHLVKSRVSIRRKYDI